ncbi:MAG TPA: 50S ribosomal protein L9 [Clostridia bacterium]|jgi:large subunit ribosomal protein L9|nr:50S ribosomal protein L9 [Clostridia bacterium]
MKVILLEDVQGHGKKGAIIEVNSGFAHNYLIPKKKAIEATPAILNEVKHKLAKEQKQRELELQQAKELANTLNNTFIDVPVRCGQGKMYGSVTTMDVQKGLAAKGFDIDKRKIVLNETIKELGQYGAEIKIAPNITANINLNVIALDDK